MQSIRYLKDETIEEGGYLIKKSYPKMKRKKVERYLRGIAKWIEKKEEEE